MTTFTGPRTEMTFSALTERVAERMKVVLKEYVEELVHGSARTGQYPVGIFPIDGDEGAEIHEPPMARLIEEMLKVTSQVPHTIWAHSRDQFDGIPAFEIEDCPGTLFGPRIIVDSKENPFPDRILIDRRTPEELADDERRGRRAWQALLDL